MKKVIVSTICIICAGAILTGCGGVYSNYREVEQLLVIETMGFDYRPGGVELSLASGISPGKGPVRLTGSGESISAAISRQKILFMGHHAPEAISICFIHTNESPGGFPAPPGENVT